MLELKLIRTARTAHYTEGVLTVTRKFPDGTRALLMQCSTLEPRARTFAPKRGNGARLKPYAIPEGTYPLLFYKSQRFYQRMWFLQDVPNFTGVMFHAGNTAADTAGCILLGEKWKNPKPVMQGDLGGYIRNSRITVGRFSEILQQEKADYPEQTICVTIM